MNSNLLEQAYIDGFVKAAMNMLPSASSYNNYPTPGTQQTGMPPQPGQPQQPAAPPPQQQGQPGMPAFAQLVQQFKQQQPMVMGQPVLTQHQQKLIGGAPRVI
jgi:hypothetical protein